MRFLARWMGFFKDELGLVEVRSSQLGSRLGKHEILVLALRCRARPEEPGTEAFLR